LFDEELPKRKKNMENQEIVPEISKKNIQKHYSKKFSEKL